MLAFDTKKIYLYIKQESINLQVFNSSGDFV